MSALPVIAALHPGLIGMFKAMVAEPDRWFTVPELMKAGPASRATAYRRCGNLVAARVLQRRRRNDQVEFSLRPYWLDSDLGQALNERLQAAD